jgi:type II secretory pathway pseudopilin PulG
MRYRWTRGRQILGKGCFGGGKQTSRTGFEVFHGIRINNPANLSGQRSCFPSAPSARRTRSRAGFSLVELLIACGILVLLVALLLPAIQGVRQKAIDVVCMSRLKDLATACQTYATHNDGQFPPPAADGQVTVVPNLLPSRLMNDLKDTVGYPTVGPLTSIEHLPPAVQSPQVEKSEAAGRGPFPTGNPAVAAYYTGYAYLGGLGPKAGPLPLPSSRKSSQPGTLGGGATVPATAIGVSRDRIVAAASLPGKPAPAPGSVLHPDRAAAKMSDNGVLWADDVFLSAPGGGHWRFAHARYGAAPGPFALTYAAPGACLGQHRAYADGHVVWLPAEHLGLAAADVTAVGIPTTSPVDAAASYRAGSSYWWF